MRFKNLKFVELAEQRYPDQEAGIKSNGRYISMQKENVRDELIRELAGMECLLIAYSGGGIDSTLLAVLAQKALSERVKCVLLDAPIVPRRGVSDAVENAHKLGLSCEIMPFSVMENEEFRKTVLTAVISAKNYLPGCCETMLINLEFQISRTALMLLTLKNTAPPGLKQASKKESSTPPFSHQESRKQK